MLIKNSKDISNISFNILESDYIQKLLKFLLSELIKLNVNNIKLSGVKKLNNISEYEFSLIKAKLELEKNYKTDIYFQFIDKHKIKESIFCYWSLIYDEECKKHHIEGENKAIITELEISKYKSSVLLELDNDNTEILKYGTVLYFIDFINYLEKNKDSTSKNIIKDLEKFNKTTLLIGIKLNSSINYI